MRGEADLGRRCRECGNEQGERDGLCKPCRLRAFGQVQRKYFFTEELREDLRRAYWGRKQELSAAFDRLERKTGWPRGAFKAEAERLGLTPILRSRKWTSEEVEYLREKVGIIPATRMARNLKRPVSSVQAKTRKLKLSWRAQEGYNMEDLALGFGVHYDKVRRWMERGLFGQVHRHSCRGGGNRVTDKNVVRFIREHVFEYDLRRVNQEWYKAMAFRRGASE